MLIRAAGSRGEKDVTALISWICVVDHPVKTDEGVGTTVTIHRGTWAYCPQGLFADCVWVATQPTPVEQLRSGRRPSEAAAQQAGLSGRR